MNYHWGGEGKVVGRGTVAAWLLTYTHTPHLLVLESGSHFGVSSESEVLAGWTTNLRCLALCSMFTYMTCLVLRY